MNKTIIRFWGCRGSFPSLDRNKMLYGGDTSCIEIQTCDNNTIILDMGTGLKRLGEKIINNNSYSKNINIFLSHYHLDHIHGFLMFAPLFNPDYNIKIYSQKSGDKEFQQILENFLQPEVWPVSLNDLSANLEFINMNNGPININENTRVLDNLHSHPNKAYSIKIETFGKKITYITDCEHPKDHLNPNVIDFANESDVLIHDAQYTPEDLIQHTGWGHSSWKEATDVANQSNSKKLILFHHSPDYNDDELNDIEKKAKLYFSDVTSAKQELEIKI